MDRERSGRLEDLRVRTDRKWDWTPLSKDNAINISFLVFVCIGSQEDVERAGAGRACVMEAVKALQPYKSEKPDLNREKLSCLQTALVGTEQSAPLLRTRGEACAICTLGVDNMCKVFETFIARSSLNRVCCRAAWAVLASTIFRVWLAIAP